MKKLIACLLSAVMLLSMNATVFAADISENGGTGQATVTYTANSWFCVVIPETISADDTFQLSASEMNIRDTEQVNVYIDGENSILMTNTTGETFNLQFNLTNDHVAEFLKGQTLSNIYVGAQPIEGAMPAAGDYTGTVQFVVRLEEKTNY